MILELLVLELKLLKVLLVVVEQHLQEDTMLS